MSSTVRVSCVLDTTDASVPLGIQIWLDDQKLFDQSCIQQSTNFVCDISDDDADHELRFVMQNKLPEHTKLDDAGNIVKDATLIIKNLKFDQIELGHTFHTKAVYRHDFNGVGPQTQDHFYGEMGCNGTVSLKFTTPAYLWLLEHI